MELKQFQRRALRIDGRDNVAVALVDLQMGEQVVIEDATYVLASRVPAKHKFALTDLKPEDAITMYGVLVGQVVTPIRRGEALSTWNIRHRSAGFHEKSSAYA